MGLDCYIIDEMGNGMGGGRTSSYSGVHILRQILINACIKYCYNNIKQTYEKLLNIYIINILSVGKNLPEHIVNTIIEFRMNNIENTHTISNEFNMKNIHKLIKVLEESNIEYDNYFEIMENNELYINAYNDLRSWLSSSDIQETNTSSNNQFGLNGVIDLSKKLALSLPIIPQSDETINYDNVEQGNLDTLNCIGISGIYKFVNHSDSDGSFSFGDCCDIVSMINKVINYVDDPSDVEWLDDIKSYYQEAIDVKGVLKYC